MCEETKEELRQDMEDVLELLHNYSAAHKLAVIKKHKRRLKLPRLLCC